MTNQWGGDHHEQHDCYFRRPDPEGVSWKWKMLVFVIILVAAAVVLGMWLLLMDNPYFIHSWTSKPTILTSTRSPGNRCW
jgi:hypothetical protein